MKLNCLQHVPFEGSGYIETWAQHHQVEIVLTRVYENIDFMDQNDFDVLVIMGGPMSVHDTDQYAWLAPEKQFVKQTIDRKKSVLGICLGAQIIAQVLGANVYPGPEKEIGWFPIQKSDTCPSGLQNIFPESMDVFHWHGETFDLPEGASRIAGSRVCQNQGFIFDDRVIGFQFHLESTPDSVKQLIANCGDELVSGPYIQTASQMSDDPTRFEHINRLMNQILDYWTAK